MDKVQVRNNCETLIDLFGKYQECAEKNSVSINVDGINFSTGTQLMESYTNVIQNCLEQKKAVRNFLYSLPETELYEIICVMYTGRDEKIPEKRLRTEHEEYYDEVEHEPEDEMTTWEELYDYYKETQKNQDGAVSTIMSKAPLVEYITKGMKYFSI